MTTVADQLGRNLLKARRRAGLTQEDLAREAELHRTAIGLLEQGLRIPLIDTVIRLLQVVEVDAADLIDGITWHRPTGRTEPGWFTVSGFAGPVEVRSRRGGAC